MQEKKKGLKLKASEREKKRYLLFEVETSDEKKAQDIIERAIFDFLGVLGYAKASPLIIKTKKRSKKIMGIIAINRKELDNVKSAFCFSGDNISVKRVSGSLKKLKESKQS